MAVPQKAFEIQPEQKHKSLTQSHFKSCFCLLIMSHTVNVASAKTLALLISAGG